MEILWNSMMKGKISCYPNRGLLKVNNLLDACHGALATLLILLFEMKHAKKALVAYLESKTPCSHIFWVKVAVIHAQMHPQRPGRPQGM